MFQDLLKRLRLPYVQCSTEKHTIYAFNNIIYGNKVSQNVAPAQIDNFDLKSAYQILQNLDQALLFNQSFLLIILMLMQFTD